MLILRQYIQVFKKVIAVHGYLLLAAAWLYTLSFVFANYFSIAAQPEAFVEQFEEYIQNEQQTFATVKAQDYSVAQIATGNSSKQLQVLREKLLTIQQGIYLFKVSGQGTLQLLYWNNNKMSVEADDLVDGKNVKAVTYQNGLFALQKHTFEYKRSKYILVGLIPLHWDYFVENKYLKNEFAFSTRAEDYYKVVTTPTPFTVRYQNQPLVYIDKKDAVNTPTLNSIALSMRLIAIALLAILLYRLVKAINSAIGFRWAMLFLVTTLLLVRVISYWGEASLPWFGTELFDAAIYASNNINKSLGDLLINTLCIFAIVAFGYFQYPNYKAHSLHIVQRWHKHSKLLIAVVIHIVAFLVAGYIMGVIHSLVVDSKIPFAVTDFFQLNGYTLLAFIIIALLLLSLFYALSTIITYVNALGVHRWLSISLALPFIVLIAIIQLEVVYTWWMILASGWTCFFYYWTFKKQQKEHVPLLLNSHFLWWLILLIVPVAVIMLTSFQRNEQAQRKVYATRLIQQRYDFSGEGLLNVALSNITDTFLSQNAQRWQVAYENKQLKDSIINANFSGYLNKYDTRIYTFDANYQPLFNDDTTSYYNLKYLIDNANSKNVADAVYYYQSEGGRLNCIVQKKIFDRSIDATLGYLFIIATPNRYKSEALFPELFRQATDVVSDLNINYAYAIYNRNQLVTKFNDYPFVSSLSRQQFLPQGYTFKINNGYSELWYKEGNKTVVIVKAVNSIWFALTLFAYLFIALLSVVIILHLLRVFIAKGSLQIKLNDLQQLNLRNQIQLAIISISLLSFTIIGVVTINYYIDRYDNATRERLVKNSQAIAADLSNIYQQRSLEKRIAELSDVYGLDVNLYDIGGRLRFSTQPYIYSRQVLSTRLHPKAFEALTVNNLLQYVQEESVASFNFLSIYAPVIVKGKPVAYINIPYLNSQNELNQEISTFLLTIINLNVFIFLLAGAFALLLTNQIVASFKLIAVKMRAVALGKPNEIITWNRNDEIGLLVNEYNRMVAKLEQSAQALARSEREGAWREMARQVAHEIKNPLTPMKLNIQYLENAVHRNPENITQLTTRVSSLLVEQIDRLAKIAGDFSEFANITQVNPEPIVLNQLLTQLMHMYEVSETLTIKLNLTVNEAIVLADATQINRLFTNLIKNALEAQDAAEHAFINITLTANDQQYVVAIADKGAGIPAEVQASIFSPNFTTKTSGTGLGLAICKGIVERANGNIWFTTAAGQGTTFYVSFPKSV
ncbi:MAG TPA: hypothetical protein DCQ29_08880 [Chitinophagaceae bacterium]|nr:hypothetical protein [Chitinophagaceae bacterium]